MVIITTMTFSSLGDLTCLQDSFLTEFLLEIIGEFRRKARATEGGKCRTESLSQLGVLNEKKGLKESVDC